MSSNNLRLECRKCKTIYVACSLPIDVMSLSDEIKKAVCPQCGTTGYKSYIYMGGEDEQGTERKDSAPVE
jgi:RNase P subunit RPR2